MPQMVYANINFVVTVVLPFYIALLFIIALDCVLLVVENIINADGNILGLDSCWN
jgi:hypothetical protein